MSKKSDPFSKEDMVLWQRVTSQLTPLKTNNQSVRLPTRNEIGTKHQNSRLKKNIKSQKRTALNSVTSMLVKNTEKETTTKQLSPIDLRYGEKAGIDGNTQRRLFRGEITVDSRLDLHGMTAEMAYKKLSQFIVSAAYEGYRCVLVITGKGSGVLKGHVPDWLKQSPLSFHVLALSEARPKDGGSGAFYVLLRRKRGGQ